MERKLRKRVGIWIRVSTADQAQGESPEHHERRARYYAEAKNWEVIELYDLSGVSGKSVLDHPETQRMLNDIKRGHIEALIFSKLARLARNTKELLDISDIFQENGSGLVSLGEAIDTTSPAGRLFYTMIAAMAQWEREEISERVKASVPIRAKMGKPTGGAAPYGYRWESKELVIDSQEAPIRKLMFELFREHKRKKTVAKILNEKGYRTRKGAQFSDTTIDRLLRDPIVIGKRRANYTQSLGDGKAWVLKPEDEWIYIESEPIVSEELFRECNEFLDKQRASRKKVGRKAANHLFPGLAYCHCGSKMYVFTNSPKYVCKSCKNKIPVDDLNTIYQEQLREFLLSEEDLQTYLHQSDDQIVERSERLVVLTEEKKKVQGEMDKIYALYMNDKISSDGFGRNYRPLEERFAQLENEIPQLQAEIDLLKIKTLSSEQIQSEAHSLYHQWENLDFEKQRQIVEVITEKIVIHDDEISIEFHYLPFFKELEKNAVTRQHNFRGSWPPPA
jgi:site-specific DNA recombinase